MVLRKPSTCWRKSTFRLSTNCIATKITNRKHWHKSKPASTISVRSQKTSSPCSKKRKSSHKAKSCQLWWWTFTCTRTESSQNSCLRLNTCAPTKTASLTTISSSSTWMTCSTSIRMQTSTSLRAISAVTHTEKSTTCNAVAATTPLRLWAQLSMLKKLKSGQTSTACTTMTHAL